MIRTKLVSLLFSFLLITTLVSCSKDDEEVISPNVVMLTNGTWTGSAIYVGPQDVTEIALEEGLDITTFTYRFDKDGNYAETYDGQSVSGTWEYTNDERVILFDRGTNTEYSVVISKLTANEFYYVQSGAEYRYSK